MMHYFGLGSHIISESDMNKIELGILHEVFVKCQHCDHYLKIVPEYYDTVHIQDAGVLRK